VVQNVEFRQTLRFAFIGVINTGVAYLFFVFFLYVFHHYLVASVLSYIVGMCFSFILNRGFVFKSREKSGQFILFCSVNLLSLGCSTGTLYLLVNHFGVYVYFAQLMSVVVSMLVNYFGYRTIFSCGVTMNKMLSMFPAISVPQRISSFVRFFIVMCFVAVTLYNMHIALLETVAHDALPFMTNYVEKFTSEGRWVNFSLFYFLRDIPQIIAFPLCNLFVFIFGYQVARSILKERWLVICFALTIVNIPYFAMLFKWPMTLVVGTGLLALFSCIKDRMSVSAVLLLSGVLLFASYPAFYFLIPLIYLRELSQEPSTKMIKFILIWIAGYVLGYIVAQLSVFGYTFWTEGHGHLIVFAGWRESTPTTNIASLITNITKSADNFKRNALYLSMLSPFFFIPVALLFLVSLKAHFKYTLIVLLVVLSIYASVIALGVDVPLRSGITFPIGMAMIALLFRYDWGKALLLITLFIPFAYKTYGYNYAYHEKRVILRDILNPADIHGYLKQPHHFNRVIVKVDEKKTSQYFYDLTQSNAFKNLTNLREHYIKPYFYTRGWKNKNIEVVDTHQHRIVGRADVETKNGTLYVIID